MVQIKNLLPIIFLLLSSIANSQSSKQRLEDIEDKLDNLILQQQLNQIEQLRRQNEQTIRDNNKSSQRNNYRNIYPESVNKDFAKYYNLSYYDFVRKDEIFTNKCEDLFKNDSNKSSKCWAASMVGISITEYEKRNQKALNICIDRVKASELEKNWEKCVRNIVVLGK
jgi:hypothetical protein